MTTKSDRPDMSVEQKLIENEAEKWFIRLGSSDISEAEIGDHHAWLQADFKHRLAYEELQILWDITGRFSNSPDIMAARHKARHGGGGKVMDKTERRGLLSSLSSRWVHTAIAASCVLVAVGGLHLGYGTSPLTPIAGDVYETRIGERKRLKLSDGSIIVLDTQTRIIADFSPEARHISLERGQARFDVAHDTYRPFSVIAGIGKITALGTTFVVKKTPTDVLVTLIEGKVEVEQHNQMTTITHTASQPDHIGQQLAYSRKGISKANIVDIPQSVAWQDGRLVFENDTLAEVVSELNRYSKKKIVIGDRALRSIRVTGVFNVGADGNALQALQNYFSLKLTTDQRGNLVLISGDSEAKYAEINIRSQA
ncbi:MAG: transmembrane sensor [Rheinheimera aquimaris]|jgi:transmembrane sensor|tara:strand:+ start:7349 stop:8452 length:1104 start_codon:yes stop_codon:yes gene_type:complete